MFKDLVHASVVFVDFLWQSVLIDFAHRKKYPSHLFSKVYLSWRNQKIIFKDRKQNKTENINTDDDLTSQGVIQLRISKDRIRINST